MFHLSLFFLIILMFIVLASTDAAPPRTTSYSSSSNLRGSTGKRDRYGNLITSSSKKTLGTSPNAPTPPTAKKDPNPFRGGPYITKQQRNNHLHPCPSGQWRPPSNTESVPPCKSNGQM